MRPVAVERKNKKRYFPVGAVLAVLAAFLFMRPAVAAPDEAIDRQVEFDIPAQPLASALIEFSKQTRLQIMSQGVDLAERKTAGVAGKRRIFDALHQLLMGTDLQFSATGPNTIAVTPASQAGAPDLPASSDGSPIRLTQAPSPSLGEGQGEDLKTRVESEEDNRPVSGIPEIFVRRKKGQRTLNADIERTRDDVRPYVILDRDLIERSGAATIDELLRKQLPMSYVQVPNSQTASPGRLSGNSTEVALRGLSAAETLILVDGRRVTKTLRSPGAGESQADLSGIPLAAIERIEVLPASASGIYGGSATGGVINVVLRRDYRGLQATLNYENSFEGGGAAKRLDLFGGTAISDRSTFIQFSGSVLNKDPLSFGDRNYIKKYRARRQAEQLSESPFSYLNAYNPPLGAATNISSFTDRFDPLTGAWLGLEPLTLKSGGALDSPITSVPLRFNGTLNDLENSLVQNAGRYNVDLADSRQSTGAGSDLIGAGSSVSLDLSIRSKFGERLEPYAEVAVSRSKYRFNYEALNARFFIPSTSLTNPFEQDIFVNAPITSEDHEGQSETKTDTARVLIGTSWRISEEWSSVLEYSYSLSKSGQPRSPSGLFLDSASAQVSAGNINLLQDPAGYMDALRNLTITGNEITPTRARLNMASARVAGPLFSLPASDAILSLLLEETRQKYDPIRQRGFISDGSEYNVESTSGQSSVQSAYAELTIPLASESHPIWGIRKAEFQVAGRYDRYEQHAAFAPLPGVFEGTPAEGDFSSTVPSVGFRMEPIRGVLFRASFSEGFLPPGLNQLQEALPLTQDFSFWTDPKRGDEPLGIITWKSGGNKDLKPEKSRSQSFGVVWTPIFVSGLRASFDWTKIEKKNNISSLSMSQSTIDNADLYPGFVTRGTADAFGIGPITGLDFRARNVLRSSSVSYDLSADYDFRIRNLNFRLSSSATRLVHNVQQQSAGSAPIEFAGYTPFPSWGGNLSLLTTWQQLSVNVNGRYMDSHYLNLDHSVDVDQRASRIGSLIYLDTSAEYSFVSSSSLLQSRLSGTSIRAGVKNLVNRKPRYVAGQGGTLSDLWDDPMGRSYFLMIQTSF